MDFTGVNCPEHLYSSGEPASRDAGLHLRAVQYQWLSIKVNEDQFKKVCFHGASSEGGSNVSAKCWQKSGTRNADSRNHGPSGLTQGTRRRVTCKGGEVRVSWEERLRRDRSRQIIRQRDFDMQGGGADENRRGPRKQICVPIASKTGLTRRSRPAMAFRFGIEGNEQTCSASKPVRASSCKPKTPRRETEQPRPVTDTKSLETTRPREARANISCRWRATITISHCCYRSNTAFPGPGFEGWRCLTGRNQVRTGLAAPMAEQRRGEQSRRERASREHACVGNARVRRRVGGLRW